MMGNGKMDLERSGLKVNPLTLMVVLTKDPLKKGRTQMATESSDLCRWWNKRRRLAKMAELIGSWFTKSYTYPTGDTYTGTFTR